MYVIEGDGSWQHTRVYRDGILIDCNRIQLCVNEHEGGWAIVDEVGGTIDRVLIAGIYSIIGNGTYQGTRVLHRDDMLRGVQSFEAILEIDKDPIIRINAILLPNIVEAEE